MLGTGCFLEGAMRKHTYIDSKARKVFENRIKGVNRETLSQVLDGRNVLGLLRSWSIRDSWRRLVRIWPASEAAIREQYCG